MILAIDIGTSGCRAGLFESDGMLVSLAGQPWAISSSEEEGYSEQNPGDILQAFTGAVQLALAGRGGDVSRVVIDSQLHSLLLVDGGGAPLTPLSIWADSRAAEECRLLSGQYRENQWQKRNGCPLSPSYPLARLLWYRRHLPSLYARFAWAVSIKSCILQKILGIAVEDQALASASGLFNLAEKQWDAEILDYIGLSVGRLPQLVPVEQELPGDYTAFGRTLGISSQALWVAGGGDGQMAHLGTVGYRTDMLSMTIGTSCAVRRTSFENGADQREAVWTYLLDGSHAISGMASSNGGNVLDWYLKNLIGSVVDWPALEAELAVSVFDAKLLFFPFLFKERTASVAGAHASGFLGVRGGHTRIDLIRSLLEGIAFHACRMATGFAGCGSPPVALSGSLAESTFVRQVIAETLARPVTASLLSHAPLYGSLKLLGVELPESAEVVVPVFVNGYAEKFAEWCEKCEVKG